MKNLIFLLWKCVELLQQAIGNKKIRLKSHFVQTVVYKGFPGGSDGKESA